MRRPAWHSWWSTALGCCDAQAQAKVGIATLKRIPAFCRVCGTIWCSAAGMCGESSNKEVSFWKPAGKQPTSERHIRQLLIRTMAHLSINEPYMLVASTPA